jgi:CO/xanthine dehydrogenase FAD-binding subunit
VSLLIAATVDQALLAMSNGARPIGGGSDLVVGARHGKAALPSALVAVDRIELLRTLDRSSGGLVIGAAVTHSMIESDSAIATTYSALADASALVGSPATRNVGTIGGNVMNASPAMDTGAPLVVLDASVELRSIHGERFLSIADLWSGPGRTVATADELCVSITLPARSPRSGSAYVRLEYRRAMEIAIVGAAASVTLAADGRVETLAVALTAVAPTILAVTGLDSLRGSTIDDAATAVAQLAADQSRPISDLRASDAYRRHCVGVMASRAVCAAARRAAGEHIAVPVNRSVGIGASA